MSLGNSPMARIHNGLISPMTRGRWLSCWRTQAMADELIDDGFGVFLRLLALEQGLHGGDKVVIEGGQNLRAGQQVTLVQGNTTP